ncbi:MAG TPA: hypothetical protein VNB67_03215 [Nitrososphaeraceae archaeon]|nr:hypothetical protein [Nitrososphaeraceae archaeon]
MATTLILSLAITLALAMLLVPAVGTVVFAQNLSGMAGNMTGNMSAGNMTSNTSGVAGNMTGTPPG